MTKKTKTTKKKATKKASRSVWTPATPAMRAAARERMLTYWRSRAGKQEKARRAR